MDFLSKDYINTIIIIGLLFLVYKTIKEIIIYSNSNNENFLIETPKIPYYGSSLVLSVFLAFSYAVYDKKFIFGAKSLVVVGFILSILYIMGYILIRSIKNKRIKQYLLISKNPSFIKQGLEKETNELYGVLILIGSILGFYLLFMLVQYIFIGEIVWWE